MRRRTQLVARSALCLVCLAAACGKKGPPLAPLNLAPEPPQAVTARRIGDTVYVQLTVPAKSAAGTGPYSVDRLEVYAATLAPGADTPPNRDFLKPAFVVSTLAIRKPVDPDADPAKSAPDPTDKTTPNSVACMRVR